MKFRKFVMRLAQVFAVVNLFLFGYMTYDAWTALSQNALDVGLSFGETLEFCLINTAISGTAYLVYAIILYCVYLFLKGSVGNSDVEEKTEKVEEPKNESKDESTEKVENEPETLNIENNENNS